MSDPIPTVAFWWARDVRTLSREELLEVVEACGRMIEDERRAHAATASMLQVVTRLGCANGWPI